MTRTLQPTISGISKVSSVACMRMRQKLRSYQRNEAWNNSSQSIVGVMPASATVVAKSITWSMFLGASGEQKMPVWTAIARPSTALNSREFSTVSPILRSSRTALQSASFMGGASPDRAPESRAICPFADTAYLDRTFLPLVSLSSRQLSPFHSATYMRTGADM